jgi:hypothetical protein
MADFELASSALVAGLLYARCAHSAPSAASRRAVVIPDLIADELAQHLNSSVGPAPTDLVFTSPAGEPLHHSTSGSAYGCPPRRRPGSPALIYMTCATRVTSWSLMPGQTFRELMERMGHSTTRAALIYLHGGDERQRKLAASVSDRARAALEVAPGQSAVTLESGTDVARTAQETRALGLGADSAGL